MAVGLALAFGATGTARAESVMQQCAADWKQAKASGAANGETWQQFLAQCKTQKKGGAASATPPAPSAAPVQPSATSGKTASECNAEYSANKAAIKARGQSKREFIAACRAGTSTVPTTTQAATPAANPEPVAPAAPTSPLR